MSHGILSGPQPGSYESGILGAVMQPREWDSGSLGVAQPREWDSGSLGVNAATVSAAMFAPSPLLSTATRTIMPASARLAAARAAAAAAARARGTHGIGAVPTWATPLNIGLGVAALVGGYLLFGAIKGTTTKRRWRREAKAGGF